VKDQGYLAPRKSVFNRIVGDGGFELTFASFLEGCPDVTAFAKNYLAVGFKLDYVKADGEPSNYIPDFFVKTGPKQVYVVETKGREELDLPQKMARLRQWCEDVNKAQGDVRYGFVYVDQETYEKYHPKTFKQLVELFGEYQAA
jgi:type III restriction enzyme